jgi:hypothetical protein
MSWRFPWFLAFFFGLAPAVCAAAEDGVEFFETKIRPVLVAECYGCHSVEARKLKAGFRLDSREGMLKGGESGKAAIAPGDPERSPLIEAIRRSNPDFVMPPKKALPAQVVADFEAWVTMGAPDPRARAQTSVVGRPNWQNHWAFQPVQAPAVPAIRNSQWAVRNPIDTFVFAKLEEKGLRPSPPADKRTLIRRAYYDLWGLPPTFEEVESFVGDDSRDAFEKVVDRLLASPRYGERWGRYWLDLARYADTKGYVYGDREEARFVHSHNYRDWVIRAFNEDMPYDRFVKLQVAADQIRDARREDLAAMGFLTVGRRFLGVAHDIIDDRIDTLTRTTQGLSVGCARCHDHKFDPIPTKDYYSLYGVFNGSTERIVPLEEPGAVETPERRAYEAELKKRTDKLNETYAKRCEEVAQRARGKTVEYLQAVLEVENLPDELFYNFRDGDSIYPVIVRQWQQYLFARQGQWSRVWGPWHELARLPAAHLSEQSTVTLARIGDERAKWSNRRVIDALRAAPLASMRDVAAVYGRLLIEASKKDAAACDADEQELRQVLHGPDAPVLVPKGSIADLEFYFDEGTRVQLAKLQMEIDKWHIEAPGAARQAVILEDRPTQENPHVFRRGNPMNRGEEVPRRYLEVIAGPDRKPFTHGSGRLELAEAIANPANPLTGRVMVNRIWLGHFGQGLVKTPSDFGMRCEPPGHPELLDWLADQLVRCGWSVKTIHRLILLSNTYRQAGGDGAADPENLWLARFPTQRLDFEAMRDALLCAGGDVDLAMGGRGVEMFKPPFAKRRTVYGRIDRQFLPGVFRTFDFANPDLHSPQRAMTTVPQQALFMMNSAFSLDRARALARRKDVASIADPAARVERLYEIVYQRRATADEVSAGVAYVAAGAKEAVPDKPRPAPTAWEYGYGEFDPATQRTRSFAKLPFFTGSAWQGGPAWPDAKLGWAQLTAEGGHAGNDAQHAVIRRWVSPIDGTVAITGTITHAHAEGHGIVARIVSSRHGELASWRLHNQKAQAAIDAIEVKRGDTIDFVVGLRESLNNNDFTWAPVIKPADGKGDWNAKKEFGGIPTAAAEPLTAWEKYAQVLLMSDEFVFVD